MFTSREDLTAIEAEMAWEARDVPSTMYQFITATKDAYGARAAVTFQLQSGVKDPAETLTWTDFHARSVQCANLFRSQRRGDRCLSAAQR